jgi:hypothetical protein
MSASVGNTINHALPRLHDIEAISHDMRSFLGLVNYFRKFIERYSEIAVPLTNQTRNGNAWDWTGRCQDALEKLKQKLVEAPLLRTQMKDFCMKS